MRFIKITKYFLTSDNSSFLSLSFDNKALSSNDKESLTDPSEIFTISFKASSEIFPFSKSQIFLIY